MSDAQHAIETLLSALAEARASAEDGAAIALAGLETAAADAMRMAREAPAGERATLASGLALLVEELDRLAAAIGRQHHAEAQHRATTAYGDAITRDRGAR